MIDWFIYAFILGFAGSFHCVGMCGAIALSLPVKHLNKSQKRTGILLYNLGRITTYAIIGIIFGILGRAIFLGGLQQALSIFAGVIILFFVISNFIAKKSWQPKFITKFQFFIQNFLSKAIVKKNTLSTFSIGFFNGWLPCGMVYFALAAALSTGNILQSVLFMIFFGLGTVPLMILVSYFGLFINISLRNTIKKAMPIFMFCIGILFVLRGLNLNIPYISPTIDNNAARTMSCH